MDRERVFVIFACLYGCVLGLRAAEIATYSPKHAFLIGVLFGAYQRTDMCFAKYAYNSQESIFIEKSGIALLITMALLLFFVLESPWISELFWGYNASFLLGLALDKIITMVVKKFKKT